MKLNDIKHNRSVLLRKLEITDLQYCEFVEQGGYEWIQFYFSKSPEMQDIIKYSPMFWKWWVNEWNIRDEYHIHQNRFKEWSTVVERGWYRRTHRMDDVIAVPNRWVIKELTDLIKQYEKQQTIK